MYKSCIRERTCRDSRRRSGYQVLNHCGFCGFCGFWCSSRPVRFDTVRLSHPIELHNIKKKITYFTEAWNLFSLAVILNFAVSWCEVWNRKIFGVTHSIGPFDRFPTFSDPFADYSNYSWFQVRPTKWPPKKTNSTHRQSKSYL